MIYSFRLLDERLEESGAFIPNGESKDAAVSKAKRFMEENDMPFGLLEIGDAKTFDLLSTIDIIL